MRKSFSAGGVVIQKTTKKVLIVEQKNDIWSLPKGHIDFGENALQAAKREIKEESGVTQLRLIKELGSYERHKISVSGQDDKTEIKNIVLFLFETNQMNLSPEDQDNPSAEWLDIKETAERLTHPKDKNFFLSILQSLPASLIREN